jgi:hypothetical protein
MSKCAKLLSLTFAMMFVAAGNLAAWPDWGPLPAYVTTLYSDATHQTVVGYITPQCHPYYGILYTLSGTYSIYGTDEYVFTCNGGEIEPL